jgi:N-sulfoglucosamine sulfohydrolase
MPPTPRPNVVLLTTHDTGRYVQPYGHAVPTPNLQRLAEEGMLFRQAFCVAPTCSSSRAALLTGQSAHNSGMIGLMHRGFALREPREHLLATLGGAGYHTALAGLQHVARDPARLGYDQVLPVASRNAADVAPAAADFLRAAPEPFYLEIGFRETHRVFAEPGPAEDARYTLPPAPLPDTPATRQDMAAFKASARAFDTGLGVILAALEEAGLAENTLVICTTDHGIAFPSMKANCTDGGIGVMLTLRGPRGFRGGQVCDALVSHLDLYPTICDVAGIARPAWLQGASLLPLVRGETAVRDEIFAEVTFHGAYEPQRAVRTSRWKYIRRYADPPSPGINCDAGPSKDYWLREGWATRLWEREQLYDLVHDPHEAHNLAGDPAAGAALADLRARLDAWMQATDDPLRHGPIAPPPGARLTDPRTSQDVQY